MAQSNGPGLGWGTFFASLAGVAVGAVAFVATEKPAWQNWQNGHAPPNDAGSTTQPTKKEFEFACEMLKLPKSTPFSRGEVSRQVKLFRKTWSPDLVANDPVEFDRRTAICKWAGWAEQIIERQMGPSWT